MLIRIDARRLTNAAGLQTVLDEAFGFAPSYGKNLDALVDCLTNLDDATGGLSRMRVFPGEVVLLVLEHTQEMSKGAAAQVKSLSDVVAFVNWRRWEKKQPPIMTLAYEHG